ncbi:MAG TPA: hypothetical protein VGC13_05385 [Longimicrobium sp.]|uniref:hypothetical protein n=1 Tax=Longimicrobium sp. TaxID=2029185 RepID=UPI002ED9C8F0
MATDIKDPLLDRLLRPDRVAYANGALLGAEDFAAEQSYHRGRLARALAYLHGTGTIAGLRVQVRPPAVGPDAGEGEQVRVEPGVALDPAGRLVEVPDAVCTRLGRWLRASRPEDRAGAYWEWTAAVAAGIAQDSSPGKTRDYNGNEQARPEGVFVVDVFLRFHPCERGYTPAIASGPFDALDAVAASRVRDGAELSLLLREEKAEDGDEQLQAPPLPGPQWPELPPGTGPDGRGAAIHEDILDAWREGNEFSTRVGSRRLREHAITQDGLEVFLARLVVPARTSDNQRLHDDTKRVISVNNLARRFVYSAGALARWITG